ncbi:UvrD-helicase domain-containing protein [Gryllotalpicola reticulitermitis]|uniref:UvrD-helicase domain-containing protein n=1 Tax=Gryllotalpicola reticulitermitis TaxID=1184153 RepID=A0ABV8Q9P5_9MICO
MSAGDSAADEADRQRQLAEAHEQAAREARQLSMNYEAAAASEKATARTLAPLSAAGYCLLPDRGWPGSRSANVDMIVIGPGGVFIVDTKSWASPVIAGGRVFRGQADVTDEFDRLADLAWKTEAVLAEVGLAPGEVHPVVAFAGRRGVDETIGSVEIVGENDLVKHIARHGRRLSQTSIDRVLAKAIDYFPVVGAPTPVLALVPEPVVAERDEIAELPSPEDVQDAVLESLMAEPIEEWMAFLSPDQAKLVRRSFNGPSRIRGAAGTGKTVVGLHRAAYLARSNPHGKVLVTTFVNTLPQVLKNLFGRLAPELADRVEFASVHQLANRILRERGVKLRLDPTRTDLLFNQAWDEASRPLIAIEPDRTYWEEEIRHVIKGRGLTTLEQYRDCARTGRSRKLGPNQRADVWKLYLAYDRRLRESRLCDFEDQILSAELALRSTPLTGYLAVIVDEAQDLSCAMIRMLAAIAGDGPDALTLIGDGQQTIYPGGYTLTEAGVALGNRGVVMEINYRNTAEILDAARSIVEGSSFTDIEGTSTAATAPTTPRHGPTPELMSFGSLAAHDAAMVRHVREAVTVVGTDLGDLAVLCFTRRDVARSMRVFADAGIPTLELTKYDGRTSNALKIGTIKRSKGLEFKQVLAPWVDPALLRRRLGRSDESSAQSEREDRDRRELFVAITRARDEVWVGSVARK